MDVIASRGEHKERGKIMNVDLSEFIGKTIKKKDTIAEGALGKRSLITNWLVVAAYPCHIKAVRTCENGCIITECFSVGELVQMGLLKSGRGYVGDGYRLYKANDV